MVIGVSSPLQHTYRINIPTVIRDLLTTLALTVEGDALIGGSLSVTGPVSFSNDSVFDGAITITSNINARGITMDLGNGRIITGATRGSDHASFTWHEVLLEPSR